MWDGARRMVKQFKGFTLIEVMIVIVIIGILATIAYPSYQEYVRSTKRADAQAQMLEVAHRLQRFKVANFSYVPIVNNIDEPVTLVEIQHSGFLPRPGDAIYTLTLTNVTPTTWTLTARPLSGNLMANDGVICLNHRNQKFWAKGASTCLLTETSNWDGR